MKERPLRQFPSRAASPTRHRRADLTRGGIAAPLSDDERRLYLTPTALMPTDGAVKTLSDKIATGAGGEIAKVRAIDE
jgi:hypothetical protein